ncbi:MAG: hypothetical protein ACE5F1_11595, partial [Planctomycetota bacterium]
MAERSEAANPDPEPSEQLAGDQQVEGKPEDVVVPEGVPSTLTQQASGARTLENPLSFERPIYEMEAKIEELKSLASSTHLDLNGEVIALEKRLCSVTADVYDRLTPWERVSVARHRDRPVAQDYIELMLDDFVELHGDRLFADDAAIVTGLGHISSETSGKKRPGRSILLIAHRKGKTVQERLYCNFGCAHPEGYRKALEKMRCAERLGLPIVTLINTPGAYPGI